MSLDFSELKVGRYAMVRGGFGSEPARKVLITEVCEDIKNGFPGIAYEVCKNGRDFQGWAYIDQIDNVEVVE